MAYLNELVKDCIQNERAFCTAECPLNLDIREFISRLQQGRFNVAFKLYQNTVGFPGIVSVLCDEPCQKVCVLKDHGGSISLKQLENASIRFARSTEPDQYNVPVKDKKIAVIGAGISGLACALRLSSKKYQVTVFERTGQIGGHLHQLLPSEVFLEDIRLQFSHLDYCLRLNTEITSLEIPAFDAIYVATGKGGDTFGLKPGAEGPFSTTATGVFMGGSLAGATTMHAIAQGLSVSDAIEAFLKTGQMRHQATLSYTTLLTPDAIRIVPASRINAADGKNFTRDESIAEAKRCLKCTCDACVHYSPLLNYFKKFPKRLTEEVEVTITPSSLDGAATLATRLISTCNHCGLCKEVCPKDIDTGEFLLRSHRTMREKGKMPWVFHEFYLRDMEFANGQAGLSRLPSGIEKAEYMFFPGCQLGASDPELVTQSYRFILEHYPSTALMLSCCGAPADWAGDEPVHHHAITKLKNDWIKLGKPEAILACAMCKQMLQRYIPEMKTRFLYNLIAEKEINTGSIFEGLNASVFDPCASRHEAELQQAIRDISQKAGFRLEPLPMEGKMAECCSYGGQVAITHPPYTNWVVRKRINQNNSPFITYCSNCRDIFAKAGKQTWHILDIAFGNETRNRKQPTVSERRNNRILLKQKVLKEFWNQNIIMEMDDNNLIISATLAEKLDSGRILASDLKTVIEYCESSGFKLFDPEKETFTGHTMIGNMTYWVEYRIAGKGSYEIMNAYCHRMKIED